MGMAEDYAKYAKMCERAMEHIKTSIGDYLAELELNDERSPIITVKSRIKTFQSAKEKCQRKKIRFTMDNIRNNLNDVAGIRITTLFKDDIDMVAAAIQTRLRLHTITIKDYVAEAKDNGYRSLHLLVQRELYFNGKTSMVPVEIQIRSLAMDLWASVEHGISYKCNNVTPEVKERFKEHADFLATFDDNAMVLRDSNPEKLN